MSDDSTTSTRARPLANDLKTRSGLLALAMFQPWNVWPQIWRERREASWLYLWFAFEGLLMRPETSARASWAVFRRGFSSLINVVRLSVIEVIIILVASYALALIVGFIVPRPRTKLDLAQIAEIIPWIFAPKIAFTALFALGWAAGIVPEDAMIFAGFSRHPAWTALYYALGHAPVVVSFAFALRAYRSGDESEVEAPRWRFAPLIVVVACALALTARVASEAGAFRPLGRGDAVTQTSFAPLFGEPAATLRFPRERPVVIDFWASWCGPCVEGLPDWQALATDANLDVDFISANVDESADEARKLLKERAFLFPAHIADAATQSRFQVSTLPTTIVLSKDGRIVEYWVGATSAATIRRALVSLKN
jgi:cytochrome c biogenesis protein CcmG, thiol:disulfide interchange protein DsbE